MHTLQEVLTPQSPAPPAQIRRPRPPGRMRPADGEASLVFAKAVYAV